MAPAIVGLLVFFSNPIPLQIAIAISTKIKTVIFEDTIEENGK